MQDPRQHTEVPRKRAVRGAVQTVAALGLAAAMAIGTPAMATAADPYPPGELTSQNIAADRTSAQFFYRIPALAHLGDGVVLASWDGRPGSAADAPNPNSIVQRRSTDNGQTWGPITTVAAGQVAAPKFGYSDPSYVVDRETGRVFLFFVYSKDQGFHNSAWGNDDADRQVISSAVTHSDDGGLTWSTPRLITDVTKPSEGTPGAPAPGDVRANFATSGEGIQLRYGPHAGRLIQQYAGTVQQANGTTAIQAYSVYSDDHGETWQRGEFVGTGMDENKVVELSDGTLMMNSRDSSNGRLRKVTLSTDGGVTWGPVTVDAALPDPTNNASIIRLHPDAPAGSAEARQLLFVNSNNGADGSRINGAARLSCDDGKTWPGLQSIATGSFAYASATVLDDDRIGVLWEQNYTNDLQFSTFDEQWLNAACAPLSVAATQLEAGQPTQVAVTLTNQESAALSGEVSLDVPEGWSVTPATVSALAPGASTTVPVTVTAPEGAGTRSMQAKFVASDGRVSQATATLGAPQLGATLSVTNTTAARDVSANPFQVGDTLSFSVRVVSSSDSVTNAVPGESNFTSGFAPTACRWLNFAVGGSYNCTTPRITLTQEDLDRGWVAPEFAFRVERVADTGSAVTVEHTGAPVALRDGVLAATIEGARSDTDRDLAVQPYAAGDRVPYAFQVKSAAPVTMAVVPVAGPFEPFLPPGAGNCRYRELPAFGSYTCTTALHQVTAAEVAQGFFVADTRWELSATGQSTRSIEVAGGEVDVVARDPRLAVQAAGVWNDADSDGLAEVGETVTWRLTARNAGNVQLDDVVVDGVELDVLGAGADGAAGSRTQVLTAADLAAGEVVVPEIDATATNGSRAADVAVEGAAVVLPQLAVWNSSTIYWSGDEVAHDGSVWQTTRRTRGQEPGAPRGPWQEYASDAEGNTLWTPSRAFSRGDVVMHDGAEYVATRPTRNQAPGGWKGPWERIG